MTKRNSKSQQSKTAKLTGKGGGLDRLGGRHWMIWIEPKGAALLSESLGPIHFVVQNHSLNILNLVAQHGDLMALSPGAVRATYARGVIRVENPSNQPALIECEFAPIFMEP